MGQRVRIHLTGRGHSGRGLEYKILSMAEVDKVEQLARGDIEEGNTMLDFQYAVAKNGLEHMIVGYTDPITPERWAGLPVKQEDGSEKAQAPLAWITCGPAEVGAQLTSLFTARDVAALRTIYRREHVVTDEDVDLIMGGKVLVTE